MKSILSLVFAVVAAVCVAQQDGQGGPKKTHHAAPLVTNGPVTQAEADATFSKVAGLIHTILHVNVAPKRSHGNPNASVSRAEVIEEFVRLYKIAEPTFTMTPKTVPYEASRLTFDKPSEKPGLILMIERGCVGPYGPLATGSKSTLTVQEFGDSVGYFLSRISECTHISSTKWTPYLHGI